MREPATLHSHLEKLAAGRDAAWREELERPFREYAERLRARH